MGRKPFFGFLLIGSCRLDLAGLHDRFARQVRKLTGYQALDQRPPPSVRLLCLKALEFGIGHLTCFVAHQGFLPGLKKFLRLVRQKTPFARCLASPPPSIRPFHLNGLPQKSLRNSQALPSDALPEVRFQRSWSVYFTNAFAIMQSNSNMTDAPRKAVLPEGSNGGDTSTTSAPTIRTPFNWRTTSSA